MGAVEQLQSLLGAPGERAEHLEEPQRRLALGSVVVPFLADIHVVSLDIENKLVFGPLLLKRLLVFHLRGAHLVAVAEHLIERKKGRGQTRAGTEEVAPCYPLALRCVFADVVEPDFVFFLLWRLPRRNELLVGGDASRDRQRSFAVRVEIALANPHGRTPKRGGSFFVLYEPQASATVTFHVADACGSSSVTS